MKSLPMKSPPVASAPMRSVAGTSAPVTSAPASATVTSVSRSLLGKWLKISRPDVPFPPAVAGAVLAVLLVTALIGLGTTRSYLAERARADQGAAALVAGRQLAINFVTMDYRTFDSYGSQVLNGASGSFHTDYAAKLADLKKVVVANQTRSSVRQVEAGLVSADADSAEVIVGLVAPTSNTASPTAIDKTYRLRLDLHRTSDANSPWKVISLDFVE